MIGRQIRELQTYLPALPAAKYALLNFASARLGWHIDRDFFFLKRLRPFGLALDIGANWGQSIVALQRTAKPNRIVCFEPNRLLADRLTRRYARTDSVQVHSCALGDEPGQFTLHVPFYRSFPFDGLASLDWDEAMSFLSEKWLARFDAGKLSCRSFEVPLRRLDEFGLAPDIVKIDVQGFELEVVRGGLETFRRQRPVTIIEMPPPELVTLLGEIDLNPYYFDGARLHPYRRQWKNALFLTPEHVARSGVESVH